MKLPKYFKEDLCAIFILQAEDVYFGKDEVGKMEGKEVTGR